MMNPRILTIQDISCVGQCSLTVALPILSACGIETAVLPSAVLSTHTGGEFIGYTFRDLTDDIPKIREHWEKQGILFDAVYTGYLGSERQIGYVKDIFHSLLLPGALKIVDPVMGDFGKLYRGFDTAFAGAMKKICCEADIILPNTTEACLLTGTEYREDYGEDFIWNLIRILHEEGMKTVVLTGVGYSENTTGVLISRKGDLSYYSHRRLPVRCHGTGDVFASSFVGGVISGLQLYDAARIAAEFTVSCIENTIDDPEHWYGVHFESQLPKLIYSVMEEKGKAWGNS